MTFRIRPEGIAQIEEGASAGMVLIGEGVAERAKANIHPYRDTGAVEDSIRVIDVYADDWPRAAVIVTTGSGDGFFVHEGTVDTPARPFFSQALQEVRALMPDLLKRGYDLGSQGNRSGAFQGLNRRFGAGVFRR